MQCYHKVIIKPIKLLNLLIRNEDIMALTGLYPELSCSTYGKLEHDAKSQSKFCLCHDTL